MGYDRIGWDRIGYDKAEKAYDKIRKEGATNALEKRKELQKTLTGKIIGGLIHGRIESINELYNFGDDVLDLVMGDLYNSQRSDDFDLIGFKEGHTNYGFKIGVREQYKEEQDDGLLSAYGLSKTISQWIIPTQLLAKSLKK